MPGDAGQPIRCLMVHPILTRGQTTRVFPSERRQRIEYLLHRERVFIITEDSNEWGANRSLRVEPSPEQGETSLAPLLEYKCEVIDVVPVLRNSRHGSVVLVIQVENSDEYRLVRTK